MPEKNNKFSEYTKLDVKLVELKALALAILAKEPANAGALNGLGLVNMRLKVFDRAVSLFQRANKIAPEQAEYSNNLIKSLRHLSQNMYELERLPEAIELLRQALSIKPNDLRIL